MRREEKQRFFDRLASLWHENHKFSEEDKLKITRLLSRVKFSNHDFILDLAGGTGRLSEFLFSNYRIPLKIFVSDISGEMLGEGKKRLNSSFNWVQADSAFLPFKDESFNHIFCFSSFPHFEDKRRVILESCRLLKKRGDFIIFHLKSREEINRFHAQKSFPISDDFLPSREEFESWVKEADFSLEKFEDREGFFLVHFLKTAKL